jgi:hypothetical protein
VQYCKALHGEDAPHLSPDQEAIRVQVSTDQDLLRERINRLTGEEGLARMEAALETLRARFIQQRKEASNQDPLDVPVEIVQIDALGNRIDRGPDDGSSPASGGDDVSSHVGNDVSRGSWAPMVGGLSAAFGGKASVPGGQVSQQKETPHSSPFAFKYPARKLAPLKVPGNEGEAGADSGSSKVPRKSPVARKLFEGGASGIANQATKQEGFAPLFTLSKASSPIHTPASGSPSLVATSTGILAGVTPAVKNGVKHNPQGMENIHMVHELLYNPDWQLVSAGVNEPDPDDSEADPILGVQKQLGVAMERAFWDSVKEGLARNPPDWARVVGLVKEVRGELEGLVPNKWKEELAEKMDTELLQQVRFSLLQCWHAYAVVFVFLFCRLIVSVE